MLLQEAAEAAPSAAEVATAQEEALNSFVFNFASTGAQLQRSVAYALLGLMQVLACLHRLPGSRAGWIVAAQLCLCCKVSGTERQFMRLSLRVNLS